MVFYRGAERVSGYLEMRRDAGLLVAARNGERAALASEVSFDATLRTAADRKMDLAEATEAISCSETPFWVGGEEEEAGAP